MYDFGGEANRFDGVIGSMVNYVIKKVVSGRVLG